MLHPRLSKQKKTQNVTSVTTCIPRVASHLVEVVALLAVFNTRIRLIIPQDARVIQVTNPRVIVTRGVTGAEHTRDIAGD